MKETLTKIIELGEGVTAEISSGLLKLKGPKGEAQKVIIHPKVSIKIEADKIVLEAGKATKREKTIIGSFQSHIKNMVKGVSEPHEYKLKICSGHFPMNVSVSGKEFIVKNFLGESVPRKVNIIDGAKVKVNGTEIVITSSDREAAGQTAARIESLCRITNRDKRIFQDGIYIINKAGKDI